MNPIRSKKSEISADSLKANRTSNGMKILITTGLSKSDIGGPAQYGSNLKDEFEKLGHEVRIRRCGSVEGALAKIWADAFWADKILALDTFSVGLPSVMAARFFGKKVIVRVGGDFLWSAYANRTGAKISLPAFYQNIPRLNFKEGIIFSLTKWMIGKTDFLAFNTEWQKNIWANYYQISKERIGVVRNFIPEKNLASGDDGKFIWAGRVIPEKNISMLKKLGIEIVTNEPHEKVLERIRSCRAAVSLAFTDICPNFIIEAVSCGKPFIVTKYTGLGEIFPEGGIFVDPMNESEIREAMENLPSEEIQHTPHSWRQLAEDILEIWKKI